MAAQEIHVRPRTGVEPVLKEQLESFQQQMKAQYSKRLAGQQTKWTMPELKDWSGDLFDWNGMHKPFDRSWSNDKFIEAIKTPSEPGTTYDMVIATTQIDYLACMERAFRHRHTFSRPRMLLHTCARHYGYSHDSGPLIQGVLEYISGMDKANKAEAGT